MIQPQHTSLEWLISPIAKSDYFQNYWEKRPLLVRHADPEYFSPLLTFEDVDRVITTLDRRYPDVCLKNANNPNITAADYTLPGGSLDVVKLYELFNQGSTITLAFLDTVIPALTHFCRNLENEFSCPFQTNVYLTPRGAQGAKPHYDTHDVFVLQVAGSKCWTLFGTPVELPLEGQRFDEQVHQISSRTLDFELQAGDVAYIPRGVAHQARSTDTVSLHITTGILRYTWVELLLEFIASVSLENAAFRKALPAGFARSGFERADMRETLRDLLQQASTASNFDAALDGFIDRFLYRCPPVLLGQMAQLATLDSLALDSLVGARPGVISRVEANGASLSVDTYGSTITFPSHAREAVRFALAHASFVVRDIPGNFDNAGKLTLVKRMIREGLLMALGS